MKQYLLSVHMIEGQAPPAPEVMQKMFADVDTLNKVMQKKGAWVFGGGLHQPESSTVVSQKDGELLVADGPFSEAKEQIGGFWILKCADLDEAIDWAKKATVACGGPVEVRPFQDEPGA